MSRNWITLASMAAAITACTQQTLPPVPPPQDYSAFDGTYVGRITLSGVAAGASNMREVCEVNPRTRIQVSDGRFQLSYQLRNYPDRPRTTYSAMLWSYGQFQGANERGAQISGQIVDGALAGTINGFGCYYQISARRS